MNKSTSDTAILSITLNRSSRTSLQSQLAQAIRLLVHDRKLRPGDKLPASRMFAAELAVSRVTITAVLEQLVAEGYLEGRRGSGVYVTSDLPDMPVAPPASAPVIDKLKDSSEPVRPFAMASPDLKEFPYRDWAKLFDKVWRNPSGALLNSIDPLGWGPLRAAIAEHLRLWRGIHCAPSQVVITSGLVEALELIGSALLGKRSHILMEEPGHQVIRRVLKSHGLSCHSVPVDEQGFDPERIPDKQTRYSAAFLTPSRHFPLGMTLPLSRRLQLLEWANSTDAVIIEDDFDGEFRYQGQPLPAMMSLDQSGRVIYVGSFSKVLFPGLRLGFLVLPSAMSSPVFEQLRKSGPRAAIIMQPVLAEFMSQGGFATHIRRMRRLYSERQKALVSNINHQATGLLEVDAEPGGMHLVTRLSNNLARRMSDRDAAKRAQDAGLSTRPLSDFYAGLADQQGLVLGYAAFSGTQLKEAVATLVQALRAN